MRETTQKNEACFDAQRSRLHWHLKQASFAIEAIFIFYPKNERYIAKLEILISTLKNMKLKERYTTILLLILGVLFIGAIVKFAMRFWKIM